MKYNEGHDESVLVKRRLMLDAHACSEFATQAPQQQ
jgi:hypothetical protein